MLATSILLAVIVAGCSTGFVPAEKEGDYPSTPSGSASSNGPTNGLVQSNTGGSVTIDVEWIKTEDNLLIFDVAMNTHSVDLDQYDIGQLAILRDNTGKEYHPVTWDSAPGGHHRSGTLYFPIPDSVNQRSTSYIEIVIQDIAGIKERVLKWEL
jgi:hypothetical protein